MAKTLIEQQRSAREQQDMLEFMRLLECYGPDTVLIWWKNGVQILYGQMADPRRI